MNNRALAYALLSMILLLAGAANPWHAPAQGQLDTGFTYQGRVTLSGLPVNAACDFQFTLYDRAGSGNPPTGGVKIGATQTVANVMATNGLFSVVLNRTNSFGANAFTGQKRWLQIAVRKPAGSGTYTTLAPRQELTPSVYALSLAPGAKISNAASTGNTAGLQVESVSGIALSGVSKATQKEGVHGENTASGNGIMGLNNNLNTSDTAGVYGLSTGQGSGVIGVSQTGFGVYGSSNPAGQGTGSAGVTGFASKGFGVQGRSNTGTAVYGIAWNGTGVRGQSNTGFGLIGNSVDGIGLSASSTNKQGIYASSQKSYGVYGTSTDGDGLRGYSVNQYGVSASSSNNIGVFGNSSKKVGVYGDSTAAEGVYGRSEVSSGVKGVGASTSNGVSGVAGGSSLIDAYSGKAVGVRGDSAAGPGVVGTSSAGPGVYGKTTAATGGAVQGDSGAGAGVQGTATTGAGVQAFAGTGTALKAQANEAAGDIFRGTYNDHTFGPTPRFRIDSSGNASASAAFISMGRAITMRMTITGPAPTSGDVIEIDPLQTAQFRVCKSAYSSKVAGVVVTNSGVNINDSAAADPTRTDTRPMVAIGGIAIVKATAINGAITPGDLLVSTVNPSNGYAMRALNGQEPPAGIVIGKALGPLASGTGYIQMLVTLR